MSTKKLGLAMALVAGLGMSGTAHANAVGPQIIVQWGTPQSTPYSQTFNMEQVSGNPTEYGYLLPAVQLLCDGSVVPATDSCPNGGDPLARLDTLSVRADTDPFISFSIGVTDIGAPSVFGFVFGTPVGPVPAPGSVSNTITVVLTDGSPTSGTSITPLPPGVPVDSDGVTELSVLTLGFPLASAGVDVGTGAGTASDGPKAGPWVSGDYTWLQLNLTFGLPGGDDHADITGTGTLDAARVVPEPTTLALLGLGLAGLGISRRRAH